MSKLKVNELDTKTGTTITIAAGKTLAGTDIIGETQIAADAVTAAKIATGAVGTTEIATNAVDTAEIAANAVTLTEMEDGTQGDLLYYSAAGAPTRLNAGAAGQYIQSSGAGQNPVWGTMTEYNDTAIRNVIGEVAIHSAINSDLIAHTLGQSFVDVFQDSSGIATLTDVVRDTTGEYCSSIIGSVIDSETVLLIHSNTTNNSQVFTDSSYSPKGIGMQGPSAYHKTAKAKFGTSSMNFGGGNSGLYVGGNNDFVMNAAFTFDFWINQDTGAQGNRVFSNGGHPNEYFVRQQSNEGEFIKLCDTGGNCYNGLESPTDQLSDGNWHHVLVQRLGTTAGFWLDGVLQRTETVSSGTYGTTNTIGIGYRGNMNTEFVSADMYLDEMRWSKGVARTTDTNDMCYSANGTTFTPPATEYGQIVNATGNFTSTTQTASGTVSKMSVIVMYTDNAGTATLNTDLIVAISANGGTNYQNVTLVASNAFSGGMKIAKASEVTITNTGTAPKYRVSFANQVSTSKETRVNGVALLY